MMPTYSTPLTPELACSCIQTSLAFYTQVLGFTIQYQRPENGFAMLERQGSCLMLDEISPHNSWIAATLVAPYGRGINLQIKTTEVDALYACVQAARVPLFLALEEKWYRADNIYLGQKQFIVQDPDGYLLRFFESLGERRG